LLDEQMGIEGKSLYVKVAFDYYRIVRPDSFLLAEDRRAFLFYFLTK
jgi:hypothetical protein